MQRSRFSPRVPGIVRRCGDSATGGRPLGDVAGGRRRPIRKRALPWAMPAIVVILGVALGSPASGQGFVDGAPAADPPPAVDLEVLRFAGPAVTQALRQAWSEQKTCACAIARPAIAGEGVAAGRTYWRVDHVVPGSEDLFTACDVPEATGIFLFVRGDTSDRDGLAERLFELMSRREDLGFALAVTGFRTPRDELSGRPIAIPEGPAVFRLTEWGTGYAVAASRGG